MQIVEEMDIVAIWLRKDPRRWMAGIVSGLIAGGVAIVFASLLAAIFRGDALFPLKLMATPFLGNKATEFGPAGAGAALIGLIFTEVVCAFWGFVYAHFSGTNSFKPLLALGLVWAIFAWIFNWNLFFQSWRPLHYARPSSGAVFFVCIAYGLSLSVLSVIGPIFQGKR